LTESKRPRSGLFLMVKYRIANSVRQFDCGFYLRQSAHDQRCQRKRQGIARFAIQKRMNHFEGSSDHGEILAVMRGIFMALWGGPRRRFVAAFSLSASPNDGCFTATVPVSVQGINDSGQIVGYGGYIQGFLGTPVQ
jgi:hypothetical protein